MLHFTFADTARRPGAGTRVGANARRGRAAGAFLAGSLTALALGSAASATAQTCHVTADVVAMDQVIVFNRLGAFNPAGMIFALKRDVFPKGTMPAAETLGGSCATVSCTAGEVQLRSTKRPRPLTLRVNEGQTICINLTNLLNPVDVTDAGNEPPGVRLCAQEDGGLRPGVCQSEQPATRHVGIHINGLKWVGGAGNDGSYVGNNASSLIPPGATAKYAYLAEKEGARVISSGPGLGGEGGSGAIASGLFGVLNVEPAGTEWYRSQVTREEMILAADKDRNGNLDHGEATAQGHPILNYGAVYPPGHPYAGAPILKLCNGTGSSGCTGEIVHNELNAVITGPSLGLIAEPAGVGSWELYPNRGKPFREFTIGFHDEVKVVQAFPGWFNSLPFTLGSVKDGFGINYGTGGIGAEIIGNRLGVGPMGECVECKYEEFFLTSWAVGDPAMIVDVPANDGLEACDPNPSNCLATGPKATKAFYPEDPSNVWHGYLNDRTKLRNVHVGTEHHVFHLHAHQWLFAELDKGSNYLDAQAMGPGSSFSYEITYGGAGNRNKTAGDSIFHCHFYPHFAQGMWGLWRVHDTFEIGSELDATGRVLSRGLLDAEICFDRQANEVLTPMAGGEFCGGYDGAGMPMPGGTPVPGVVPLPGTAMPPMPGRYVADTDGENGPDTPFLGYPFYIPGTIGHRPPTPPLDLVSDGGIPRHVIDGGTADAHQTPTDMNKELTKATGYELPEDGTPEEKAAMAFHGPQSGGVYHSSFKPDGSPGSFEVNGLPPIKGAPFADPCRSDMYDGGMKGQPVGNPRSYKASVIELDVDFNKVGWHFGQQRIIVLDEDVDSTKGGTRAPEPFVMRANSGDCVDFDHTNRVPNVYQLDDFQVETPTDVIGQHIHLVKFDVMSADGAANGWNYEDGTLSSDEITERILALNAGAAWTGRKLVGSEGFRTTRQRWYIDPGWSGNVFTHDHYGPSTHQQAGLYGTLLVEPEGSQWFDPVDGTEFGTRADGGPTSWRADIHAGADAWREFYLEFADFQLAYRGQDDDLFKNVAGTPVNPSDRKEVGLPDILLPCQFGGADVGPNGCRPEAISAADPGTFVVNYRNEPLALRVRDPETNEQAAAAAGDLSYAFSSQVARADARLNAPPAAWPYGTSATASQGAYAGDPFTPMMRVYEGDKVNLRIQVGAHEEGHNFSMHGVKWLQQWASGYSGFRDSQVAGISEQFLLQVPALSRVRGDQEFEDHVYQVGSSVDARWNGAWGLMRSYKGAPPPGTPALRPLPTNPDGRVPPGNEGDFTAGVCPQGAPNRTYVVAAVAARDVLPDLNGVRPGMEKFTEGTLVYNPNQGAAGPRGPLHDPTALLYVLENDLEPLFPEADECQKSSLNPRASNKNPKLDIMRPLCAVRLRADAPVEPLILRANAGDCIRIELFNKLPEAPPDLDGYNLLPMIVNQFNANDVAPSGEVGLHAQLVSYAMSEGDGMNVGFNNVQTAAPSSACDPGVNPTCYKAEYVWYAGNVDVDPETGNRIATPVEFGAINLMASDPIKGSNKGLIGALVVEPYGSTWTCDQDGSRSGVDCDGGRKGLPTTRAAATVRLGGNNGFRDFVLLFQDDVNLRFADGRPVPAVSEEEEPEDSGQKGLNYRTDPIWFRLPIGPTANADLTRVADFTAAFADDPVTPVFTAAPGEKVRFRVLKPGGHNRNHVFTLHGHLWARHPFNSDSTAIDPNNSHTFWHGEQMGHGPTNHVDIVPRDGAGARGDYLYRDIVPVHVYNGIWGVLRVQ